MGNAYECKHIGGIQATSNALMLPTAIRNRRYGEPRAYHSTTVYTNESIEETCLCVFVLPPQRRSGDVWAPRKQPTYYYFLTSAARLSWSHLPTSSHERLYVVSQFLFYGLQR